MLPLQEPNHFAFPSTSPAGRPSSQARPSALRAAKTRSAGLSLDGHTKQRQEILGKGVDRLWPAYRCFIRPLKLHIDQSGTAKTISVLKSGKTAPKRLSIEVHATLRAVV